MIGDAIALPNVLAHDNIKVRLTELVARFV